MTQCIKAILDRLEIDCVSGEICWARRPNGGRGSNMFNTKYAGKIAGSTNGHGYLAIQVYGVKYLSHRLILAKHLGEWPPYQVDHINGVKTDNRIANLRVVTQSENAKNRRLPSNNTSGVMGVGFRPDQNAWSAHISQDGKRVHLGSFKTMQEAVFARKAAEADIGYSANHGRQAIRSIIGGQP